MTRLLATAVVCAAVGTMWLPQANGGGASGDLGRMPSVSDPTPRPTSRELDVPLAVTEPAGVDRVQAPVTGGVPIGPLGVRFPQELVLVDAAGKTVQAQFSPMVTHEDGHYLWVLVDFLTDLKAKETRTFTLRKGQATLPAT